MKKTILLGLCAAVLLGMVCPVRGFARELDEKDKRKIECAMFKMWALGNYFDVNISTEEKSKYKYPSSCGVSLAGKTIKVPEWFPQELEEMEKLKVTYIPQENVTLSEATLWYRTISNVYSYLNRANSGLEGKQTEQAKAAVAEELSRGYVRNRIYLISNLDRLNKELVRGEEVYNMKDSMKGRARSMLATLEVINQEFFSTIEAFGYPPMQKDEKYRQSVMAVVALANQLWSEFRAEPLPKNMPDEKAFQTTDGERVFQSVLLALGAILMGYAIYLFLENKQEEINAGWERYREKSTAWADDFNRQFLTIDVKYIVFGTLGVFMLVGLLVAIGTGGLVGIFLFGVFTLIGGFISIHVPKVVLEQLKRSRGVKINKQLMDSLILLSNSLRSGMDIVQGFELVSHDMQPPIADEFGLVIKNYQLGTPFEKALEGLDERVESRMLSYTIKAIIIQRQVGGNLTVIFSRLVENIREESKLTEKLDALTAQQRIQALVVGIMPIIMMIVMFMFRPDEMIGFYTTPVGVCVFLFCFVWILIGMKLISKLGEVRV